MTTFQTFDSILAPSNSRFTRYAEMHLRRLRLLMAFLMRPARLNALKQCWCRRALTLRHIPLSTKAPNTRVPPPPLRGRKIAAILKAGVSSTVVAISTAAQVKRERSMHDPRGAWHAM